MSFKAAAIHADSVMLDLDGSLKKAAKLATEAAQGGARIVVFPEVFLPGYPHWCWVKSFSESAQLAKDYFDQAFIVGGPHQEKLSAIARDNGIWLIIGANERENASLYNTMLFLDPTGKLVGRHRKLLPIGAEKCIWSSGDARDLISIETEAGKLGGLICGEHLNDPLRFTQSLLRNKIHAAIWPAISAIPAYAASHGFDELSWAATRHHAVSAQAFVINAQGTNSQASLDRMGLGDRPDLIVRGGGRSSIISPTGQTLAGPHKGEEEKILYGDLDLNIFGYTQMMDPEVYSRPDVFHLTVIPPQPPTIIQIAPPPLAMGGSGVPVSETENAQ